MVPKVKLCSTQFLTQLWGTFSEWIYLSHTYNKTSNSLNHFKSNNLTNLWPWILVYFLGWILYYGFTEGWAKQSEYKIIYSQAMDVFAMNDAEIKMTAKIHEHG